MSSASMKSSYIFAILVISVGAIDGQCDGSAYQHHCSPSNKEHGISCQHCHLSSKVAAPECPTLCGTVLLVIILASEDAHMVVVPTKPGDVKAVKPSTAVAKTGGASIASHVIAALRSLDVHSAQGTLLAVRYTIPAGCGPLLEPLVTLLKFSALHILVPRGMAVEAPVMVAFLASYANVFLFVAPQFPWQTVLGDLATVGTGLSVFCPGLVQTKAFIFILC